jgi:hypothetical protein
MRFKEVIGLVATIFTAALIAFFRSKLFQPFLSSLINFFSKNKNKSDKPEISDSDIINHDVFNYIDFWVYNQIPSLSFDTDYKTFVFRKYLQIYFRSYKSEIKKFLNEKNYKNMDNSELRKNLLSLITDIIKKMEDTMRDNEIPNIIIVKMKNSLIERMDLTMDLINSVSESSFYDSEDNLLKMYSFLNVTHSVLDNTISNIEKVINELNGELSGLSMGGYTEPKRHH